MTEQQYPEPTVGVFVFDPQGRLLLLRSHKWPGVYVIPGGHLELGERLEDAARREALEETGLDIHSLEFLNFQEFIYDSAFWKRRHFIFFDYAARTDSSNVRLNDEAESYLWVTPLQALELPLDRYTRASLEIYLKKHALLQDEQQ